MIRSIIEVSLRFRYVVIILAVVLMVFGYLSLRKMSVDIFPEFEPPMVEVQTEALGLSATEVESLVTLNVEEFLSGTPWLKSIHSESIPGLSSIVLTFQQGTNLMSARQFVQENLLGVYTLPNVSKPPVMLQPVSATRRAMMIGLSSHSLSPMQVSVIAQWTIKPRLMSIPGVANVVIWGQRNRQLQVQIDPLRMEKNNITQEQIISTTGDSLWFSHLSYLNASVPGTGGWIDTPNQRLGIRHALPISTADDLAKIPIYQSTLRLGDVANIVEGHPPLIGDAFIDGEPGIILVIEKFPWASTLKVTHDVTSAMDALQAGLPDLTVDLQIFQLADYIHTAVSNLTIAILFSILLAAIALLFLFFNWRAAFISFITIPLSIMTTAIILHCLGSTINLMILTGFGIVLAIIVDDAIVDVEKIIRYRKEQEGSQNWTTMILNACLEVRAPIIYATLIIILAICPIFFLRGLTGAFFQPLALSYVLALLVSLLIAFTVTPALASVLLKEKANINHRERFIKFKDKYEAILQNIIGKPRNIYIATIVIVLVSLIIYPFFNQAYLPTFKEKFLTIDVDGPPGMSQLEMNRIVMRMTNDLKALPGVRKVNSLVGRAVAGDKIVNINSSQLWVSIDSKTSYDQTMADVKKIVDQYQGLERDIQTYLTTRIRRVISGENEDIVVRISGPKWETLRELAGKIEKVFSKTKGLVDIQVDGQVFEPQIEIKVDIDKATPLGIKPGDVRRAVATIFAGLEAGSLFESQKVFDVVVWSIPAARNSITSIQNTMIDKPGGGYVRLGDIASVAIVPSPTVISHESISPYIDIVANVSGRSLDKVVSDLKDGLKAIAFPLEYHPEFLGEYTERQHAKRTLCIATITILIIIFFLLQACFNSWCLALLAFLALPTALVGGVYALLLTGGTVSIGSIVGMLAVLGIAARNGISLIYHYQNLERYKQMQFGKELVIQGTKDKLMPILATAITSIVILLPFIFYGMAPGLEIIHPMAVVIVGGLVTSTLLNLTIIPPLYLLCGARSKRDTEVR